MWQPQPGAQAAAFSARWVDELFYGGERGGGKSDFQLGYQEDAALRYEGKSRGIMFRKTYAELEELQGRAMEMFPATGAIYKTQSSAQYPYTNSWYWPNGATVKMRYIEHERDYGRYHGHQYSHQSFDEVTEYPTPNGMIKMFSCLRNANGVPCSIRSTGNPGGVGHGWVKARYIDNGAFPLTLYRDPESDFSRMFVPSRTTDNQILLGSDPNYIGRIIAATNGNEALRKAWLEGDWNIVAGAFFDCWSLSRHVIRPFDIPETWHKFISGDWGSARPFSFGWWSIVGDDYQTQEGLILPRGCLVRFQEWYGMKYNEHGQPLFNIGMKLTAEEVGVGVAERSRGHNMGLGVLDPAAFSEDGGPSIAERIRKAADSIQKSSVRFRRADNARVPHRGAMGGWDQMRSRLIGESYERPMLVFFNTCRDSIRTIPILQHDADKLEDLDTQQEDHAADEVRYACMSRPYARKIQDNTAIDQNLISASIANISMGKITQNHLKAAKARRENAL